MQPARAGHVKAGRSSAATPASSAGARPLHDRARRQAGGVGPECASIGSSTAIRDCRSLPVTPFSSRSRGTRRIMDLRKLQRRNVPNGITEVSRTGSPRCRGKNHAVAEARPGRDDVRQDGEGGLRHAAGATGECHWNGRRVVHIRCRMTANLRATAIVAFLVPIFLASAWPHVCSVDGRHVRLSRTFAAS